MIRRQLAAIAATLALTSAASVSAAPLLVNASFESNVISQGSLVTRNVTGWTTSNLGAELRNHHYGDAFDGNNFLELDVGVRANSWIEQSISTVAGTVYDLYFAYSARQGNASPGSNKIEVKWNNAVVGTVFGKGSDKGNYWVQIVLEMTATSNLSTLRFSALGTADGLGGAIDGLQLVAREPEDKNEVPEPATPAIFGLGLAVLAGVLRRRQK